MEELGCESALTWDGGATTRGLVYYTTAPAPKDALFTFQIYTLK